ncbi:MAG: RNA-binding protein [Pseudolabrys sp.]|nr:RNA-binding protein [Pseudolabrys sp.]
MLAETQGLDVQEQDLDRGAISVAAGTERTCALSRDVKPVSELIRFVLGPAGEVVPDVKRKLPGRGIWVTATRTAIEDAVKRNVFARGFKRDVRMAKDLALATERLLERSALDALAIAGKGGKVVCGYAKVEAAVGRDGIVALIHAKDAAVDGVRKLDSALHRARGEKTAEIAVIGLFAGQQLDLALSRPNVVHAALLAGPGSETFLARVKRLERFRTGYPDAVSAPAPIEGTLDALKMDAPTDGAQGKSTE